MNKEKKIFIALATSNAELQSIEDDFKKSNGVEIIPFAVNISYIELCNTVKRDREGNWKNPVYFFSSRHKAQIGVKNLSNKIYKFIKASTDKSNIDVLSITAYLEDDYVTVNCLVRCYNGVKLNFKGLYKYLGESSGGEYYTEDRLVKGKLLVPDVIKNFSYSQEDIQKHDENLEVQKGAYDNASLEKPFLNSISKYEPRKMYTPQDVMSLVYDLKTFDKQTSTMCSYELFNKTFRKAMRYANTLEYESYLKVIQGTMDEQLFMEMMQNYIMKECVENKRYNFPLEDMKAMLDKLHRALFQLYIVQDIIDDPNVTDVNITAPDVVRVRVKGNTYTSNVTFLDLEDYIRFVNMVVIRNRINTNIPSQTFTDSRDDDYILRFSITVSYVNSVNWPYLHIRKIPRKKMLDKDLIAAGMFDEKIRDYLIDCARDKTNGGVVFCGPPGSGKTVILNWFLECGYEDSASILVIQENDELFAQDRKGIMFEHVVNNPIGGQQACSLEKLGQLALVAGANVFVIGEAKGPEICSALTLANSGCRTALTLHTNSSTEATDKMADLAMRGYATNYEQAKRSVKSFRTIVYLQDFKVQEISEIDHYDEEMKDFIYKPIYRRSYDENASRNVPDKVYVPQRQKES